jgi:type IV pilus assembly protein PilB
MATPIPVAPADLKPVGDGNPKPRKRLGDQLVDAGLISHNQLMSALDHQKVHGGRIGSVLVALGFLREQDLESQLGQQLGVNALPVENVDPEPALLKRIKREVMERYEFIPLRLDGDVLTLCMTDPKNMAGIDAARFMFRCKRIEPRLISETTFSRFMETRFGSAMLMERILNDHGLDARDFLSEEVDEELVETIASTQHSPVVRLVNFLLTDAIERRASDIHLEPYETFFRVRYRIDGALTTVLTPPRRLVNPIIGRVKILSEMDIAERRKPQDGHIAMAYGEETVHFRVSALPTVYGEKVVIRLLKKEAHLADVGRLGFSKTQMAAVARTIRMTQGLVLVTGPTGSGKTTTLHAMLNDINDPDINIVTVEDPVEQALPGINHVQIQDNGGVTFASGLRSILRQDPDVVFVGEMRDTEVSRIAVKASLTGHLVLSTLHTNGVLETFNRLMDMGLESYLLASSLKLVLAQRLLRRFCDCATVRPIPERVIADFKLTREQASTALYKEPKGCSRCMDVGYRGRVAVYESLVPSAAVKQVLRNGGGEGAILEACKNEFVPMWEAGIARALAGETSFSEVTRVLAATQD